MGVGGLLYRNGDDFQGMHSDRELKWLDDTLIGIVRNLQCSSVQEVAQINGLKHHHLAVGHTIKLPACP